MWSNGSNQITRQQPDHTAATRSRGKNRITRDKSGTKRDLQEPNGDPGYSVTVHISKFFKLPFELTAKEVKLEMISVGE